MQLEMIPCPVCGNPFPKKRKELGFNYCVDCSTVQPYTCQVEAVGEGEDIHLHMQIMNEREAEKVSQRELAFNVVFEEYLDDEVVQGNNEEDPIGLLFETTIEKLVGEDTE